MMVWKRISEFIWEFPKEGEMKVPARVFASEKLMKGMMGDKSLEQLKNVAKLPGILRAAYGMPDVHQGYGFPIGGVAAFDLERGVISPGGVGYDINCSVRLLRTNLFLKDLKGKEGKVLDSLFKAVPSGVGRGGKLRIGRKELDEILARGARWFVEMGYGKKEDYLHTEEGGMIKGAEPGFVSERAKSRGLPQLGTLGAGNHFLDVLVVDEIFDEDSAKVFGLERGQVVVLIHCGSRGLGHQVASDYIKLMDEKFGHPSFDRELVNAPINSDLGRKYLGAMSAAANFAFANKQLITHNIREAMKRHFGGFEADVVYDVCHNIAKFERHDFDGVKKEVLVMRKGATRSFGPGRVEIPADYRGIGQPVLIPGTMGSYSYVLKGTKKAEELSFGSTAHGAGRVKSRSQAKRDLSFEEAKNEMKKRGIYVRFGSARGIVEESPFSYKDIDEVVRVSDELGIGELVAKLRPVLVMIG